MDIQYSMGQSCEPSYTAPHHECGSHLRGTRNPEAILFREQVIESQRANDNGGCKEQDEDKEMDFLDSIVVFVVGNHCFGRWTLREYVHDAQNGIS